MRTCRIGSLLPSGTFVSPPFPRRNRAHGSRRTGLELPPPVGAVSVVSLLRFPGGRDGCHVAALGASDRIGFNRPGGRAGHYPGMLVTTWPCRPGTSSGYREVQSVRSPHGVGLTRPVETGRGWGLRHSSPAVPTGGPWPLPPTGRHLGRIKHLHLNLHLPQLQHLRQH